MIEQSDSPVYYRSIAPQQSQMLSLRAAPNLSYLVEGVDGEHWAFGVDAFLSAWFDVGRGLWRWALVPELGYSFTATADGAEHLASAGIGPALRRDWLMIGIIPRGLIGSAGDELVLGVRTSLVISLGYDYLFGAEISHRWIEVDHDNRHDLTAGLWVDIIGVLTRL